MSETTHVPAPGSRLAGVASAAGQEAPRAEPATGGTPEKQFTVQTRSHMPEECIPRTVILSASNPYLPAAPMDEKRRKVTIVVQVNAVYLCESRDQASQAAAFVAASGTNPGYGIGAYLPAGTYVLESRGRLWLAASTTVSATPVAVIAERYADATA